MNKKSVRPSNRKCVVVGQKMVKTEEATISSGDKINVRLSGASQDSLAECGAEKEALDLPNVSPSGSIRSSGSSFLNSSFSGLDVSISSSECNVLDELKASIEDSAAQLTKLEEEVQVVPHLRLKVDEAEKEKKRILEGLSEKNEMVETMKQRLSVLHEQNSQLAQLIQSSSSGSETTLRMRNALVASLAQLKRLQGIADEVPDLKQQISILKEEKIQLKHQEEIFLKQFSSSLPEGTTPQDYRSLKEENDNLKKSNEDFTHAISKLSQEVEVLSIGLEDIKGRVGDFEEGLSASTPSSSYVEKLQKEKEDLYDEIIRLRLGMSIPQNIGAVYTDNECASLRKANSVLQNKLDETTVKFKQQKEKIAAKVFEIEISNIKSRKLEAEKCLSNLDLSKSATNEPTGGAAALPPQFKGQVLKVHQFQLQYEQSHQVTALLLSEKEALERELAELHNKLETKSIAHLEANLKDYKNKLEISHSKITDLEKRLCFSSQMEDFDHASLVRENATLKSQLSLYANEDNSIKIEELKKKLADEQRSHEVQAQKCKKLKDQNKKLESKLRESRSKYQSLGSELANSVQLMKKYQVQCICFEKDMEVISAERESFRKEVSTLKAQLEVIKAEYANTNSEEQLTEYVGEIKRISEENTVLKEELQRKNDELLATTKRLEQELTMTEEYVAIQKVNSGAMEEAKLKIHQLEVEKEKLVQSEDHRKHALEERELKLSQELKDSTNTVTGLRSRVDVLEKESDKCASHAKDIEAKLSLLLTEVDGYKCENSELSSMVSDRDRRIDDLANDLKLKAVKYKEEVQGCYDAKARSDTKFRDEIEGYNATIKSLQKRLEEAETREMEHELLRQTLESSLENSSHDKTLLQLLQEKIPSLSQAEQSLQERNLQLEEQISVLSQWNDKHQQQIEQLERALEESSKAYSKLVAEVHAKEDILEENMQLKRELKEVEIEVNSLRRQFQADLQEELKVKLEAKTQLLSVFNQHNAQLQQQVESLQSQVKYLGGKLDREKAASPPPMPDIALSLTNFDDHAHKSVSSLEKENIVLKQRIELMEEELGNLCMISASVRRCGSSLFALSSISTGSVKEDFLGMFPREMHLPCSLVADHLKSSRSLYDPAAQSWISAISREWFACVSQRALTPACAQCYIASISQLSHQLLHVVVNLQDLKGNTALHYSASTGNLPVLNQFINLQSCDSCLQNKNGYNALMLLSACTREFDISLHKEAVGTMVERSGVNSCAKRSQQTALMLAAGSGNSALVNFLLEKGACINAKDQDGSTALMFAVQKGHEDIIKLLASWPGSDVQAKDNEGHTAKDLAKVYNYHSIFSFLKKSRT